MERFQIIELNKDYNNKFDEFYYFNKYSMKYKKENIKYSFNGFEIILSSFCKIFRLSKNLELKVDFKEKATNILNTKLDIILYITTI